MHALRWNGPPVEAPLRMRYCSAIWRNVKFLICGRGRPIRQRREQDPGSPLAVEFLVSMSRSIVHR